MTLIPIEQAAERLAITKKTCAQLCYKGRLDGVKSCGVWAAVTAESLASYVEHRGHTHRHVFHAAPPPPGYDSIADVAERLHVTDQWIRRLLREGKLEGVKVNGVWTGVKREAARKLRPPKHTVTRKPPLLCCPRCGLINDDGKLCDDCQVERAGKQNGFRHRWYDPLARSNWLAEGQLEFTA